MKLLTVALEAKFLRTGSQEHLDDPEIIVKFFTPWSNWTWYATEYDPVDRIFFGFVVGMESEWGYFSLDEMETVKGPAGLRIERDTLFTNKKISDLRQDER